MYVHLSLIFLFLIKISTLNAAHIFTGAVSNQWNHPSNWYPQSVPTLYDDVEIPSSYTGIIDINQANASSRSVTYDGTNVLFIVQPGWKWMIGGNLNIQGASTIAGGGTLEFTGSGNATITMGSNANLAVGVIEVRKQGTVSLQNNLNIPYSIFRLISGEFNLQGYSLTALNIIMEDNTLSKIINCQNSQVKTDKLFIYLNNSSAFNASFSNLIIEEMIFLRGSVQFYKVRFSSGAKMMLDGAMNYAAIEHLYAEGDISLQGTRTNHSKMYYIGNLYLLSKTAICTFSEMPYVACYEIQNISQNVDCASQYLITDGQETNGDRIGLKFTVPTVLYNTAIVNAKATPGLLTVMNGTDLGNNQFINFGNTSLQTLFWIGGNGNWDDGSHWSYTSGGIPAGCIPNFNTDVVMDAQSGFVNNDTIDITNHTFCHSITIDQTIASKPTLIAIQLHSMNIIGDVDLRGALYMDLNLETNFFGHGNYMIHTNSLVFGNQVSFWGKGKYVFEGAFNVSNGTKPIYHNQGTIDLASNSMIASDYISDPQKTPTSYRSLKMIGSLVKIGNETGPPGNFVLLSNNFTLFANKSTILYPYKYNLTPLFLVTGGENLSFNDVYFDNPLAEPIVYLNQRSSFQKLIIGANATIDNLPTSYVQDGSQTDSLIIIGGYKLKIQSGGLLRINSGINVRAGICNNLAYLTSTHPAIQTTIQYSGSANDSAMHLICKNIHISGNLPFRVINGVDHSNNTNIIFDNQASARIFYWNGEANRPFWTLADNWNIGQMPHAGANNDAFIYNPMGCLPGFIDSVVFCPNSFPMNDTVQINASQNFTGMNWMSGSGINHVMTGSQIYQLCNYGGLRLDNGLLAHFNGITRMASSYSRTIETNNTEMFGRLIFSGVGSYSLLDDLYMPASVIEHYSGSFFTNGHYINARNYLANYLPYAGLYFEYNTGTSVFYIHGNASFSFYQNLHTLNTDNTTIYMLYPSPYLYVSGTYQQMRFKSVFFENTIGKASLLSSYYDYPVSFQNMSFAANGRIYGSNYFDTLALAEGNIYELESGAIQEIQNKLISKGSPCFRTTIQSTIPGTCAKIYNANCDLEIEHARLRDIEAVDNGCSINHYIVDVGGENLGNNPNWTFIPGDPINGLGPDTILGCKEIPYPVNTNGFGSYQSLVWGNNNIISSTPYWVHHSEILQVEVTYSDRCIVTDTCQVTVINTLSHSQSVTPPTCFGDDDGELIYHIHGGNDQYTQTWVSSLPFVQTNDSTLTQLSDGWYQHIVSQIGFEYICSDTMNVHIVQPDSLYFDFTTHNVSCKHDSDGVIQVQYMGGNGGVDYLWSHNSSLHSDLANGLYAGVYEVTVTDSKGCQSSINVLISEPDSLQNNYLLIPSQCAASNGVISIQTTGGSGNYVYEWSNDPTNSTSVSNMLSPGNYQVVVWDDHFCSDTIQFSMYDTNQVFSDFVITNPLCYGSADGAIEINPTGGTGNYSYQCSYNNLPYQVSTSALITALIAGEYSVLVTDELGCEYVSTLVLYNPSPISLSDVQMQMPSCFGNETGALTAHATGGVGQLNYYWPQYQLSDSTLSNIMAGYHQLYVTDAHNCTSHFNILLKQPDPIEISLNALQHISCHGRNDGEIELNVLGGTPAYIFELDSGQQYSENLISGLHPGFHSFRVTDVNGCKDSIHISIQEPEIIQITLDTIIPGKCGVAEGIINIEVNGGVLPYHYNWSNGTEELNNTTATNNSHSITVTDANGCKSMAFYEIGCNNKLLIPELLTPNYDGYSDSWEINDLGRLYPNNKVQIFNRWGSLVFEMDQYDGSFHGISNTSHLPGNGFLPEATYYYLIDLGDGYGSLTGFLELDY
ncbi:MAG: gliding motility-associated C-terminal domain-containing protein [Flavobacteriales bacterium]|nr:gliding motility-associated C-terminal domain-containing protein [Flavobacteriales bacterium]